MSLKLKQKLALIVAFSLAVLLLSPPVHALPSRRPVTDAWKQVAALGNSVLARIGRLWLGAWQPGAVKEGMSIDPNGSPKPQSPQPGSSSDEGVTIDPYGKP